MTWQQSDNNDKVLTVKKLIKKLKDKEKKDTANFSEEKLKKYEEKEYAKSLKAFKERQAEKKKNKQIIKKELVKFKDKERDLISLETAINKRYNVSKTSTKAAQYETTAIYFNAIKVFGMPKDYYPYDPDAPDLFIPPDIVEDHHYWLFMFQLQTSENNRGHTIPSMPSMYGTSKEFVIHGFLFPMTSTTIHLGKFKYDDKFGVIYNPNDELFGREWMSSYTESYFKTYNEAYNEFEKIIEKHLDGDEDRFYDLKKKYR